MVWLPPQNRLCTSIESIPKYDAYLPNPNEQCHISMIVELPSNTESTRRHRATQGLTRYKSRHPPVPVLHAPGAGRPPLFCAFNEHAHICGRVKRVVRTTTLHLQSTSIYIRENLIYTSVVHCRLVYMLTDAWPAGSLKRGENAAQTQTKVRYNCRLFYCSTSSALRARKNVHFFGCAIFSVCPVSA